MKPMVGTRRDGGRDTRAVVWERRETTGHCFKLTGRFSPLLKRNEALELFSTELVDSKCVIPKEIQYQDYRG